jgi:hypothetical protein
MWPGRVGVAIGEPTAVQGQSVKDRGEVTRLVRESVARLREEAAQELVTSDK